ncbi:MAG: acyltransferase [Acidobacteria bacterium]|nr:acyltransferase [Acidobacteriota bacterium]
MAQDASVTATHFGSLDGLRCLSILAVIWHHSAGAGRTGLAGMGHLGVSLFFLISGFLITTLLLRERQRTGRISLTRFYARRALRIFPAYYAVLGLYVVFVLTRLRAMPEGEEFLANLPAFATYTSNWFVGPAVVLFGFAWSLAAEEQFYCAWPWVERALPSRAAVAVIVSVLAVAIGWQTWGPPSPLGSPLLYRILANIPVTICWGVLLAHVLHSPPGFASVQRLCGLRWSAPAALLLALAAMSVEAPWRVIELTFLLLVAACVIREDNGLRPLLAWPPLAYIGTISYGMYLYHVLVFRFVLQGLRAWAVELPHEGLWLFALCTAGTIAVSALSYRFFESRFLRLKSRFQ